MKGDKEEHNRRCSDNDPVAVSVDSSHGTDGDSEEGREEDNSHSPEPERSSKGKQRFRFLKKLKHTVQGAARKSLHSTSRATPLHTDTEFKEERYYAAAEQHLDLDIPTVTAQSSLSIRDSPWDNDAQISDDKRNGEVSDQLSIEEREQLKLELKEYSEDTKENARETQILRHESFELGHPVYESLDQNNFGNSINSVDNDYANFGGIDDEATYITTTVIALNESLKLEGLDKTHGERYPQISPNTSIPCSSPDSGSTRSHLLGSRPLAESSNRHQGSTSPPSDPELSQASSTNGDLEKGLITSNGSKSGEELKKGMKSSFSTFKSAIARRGSKLASSSKKETEIERESNPELPPPPAMTPPPDNSPSKNPQFSESRTDETKFQTSQLDEEMPKRSKSWRSKREKTAENTENSTSSAPLQPFSTMKDIGYFGGSFRESPKKSDEKSVTGRESVTAETVIHHPKSKSFDMENSPVYEFTPRKLMDPHGSQGTPSGSFRKQNTSGSASQRRRPGSSQRRISQSLSKGTGAKLSAARRNDCATDDELLRADYRKTMQKDEQELSRNSVDYATFFRDRHEIRDGMQSERQHSTQAARVHQSRAGHPGTWSHTRFRRETAEFLGTSGRKGSTGRRRSHDSNFQPRLSERFAAPRTQQSPESGESVKQSVEFDKEKRKTLPHNYGSRQRHRTGTQYFEPEGRAENAMFSDQESRFNSRHRENRLYSSMPKLNNLDSKDKQPNVDSWGRPRPAMSWGHLGPGAMPAYHNAYTGAMNGYGYTLDPYRDAHAAGLMRNIFPYTTLHASRNFAAKPPPPPGYPDFQNGNGFSFRQIPPSHRRYLTQSRRNGRSNPMLATAQNGMAHAGPVPMAHHPGVGGSMRYPGRKTTAQNRVYDIFNDDSAIDSDASFSNPNRHGTTLSSSAGSSGVPPPGVFMIPTGQPMFHPNPQIAAGRAATMPMGGGGQEIWPAPPAPPSFESSSSEAESRRKRTSKNCTVGWMLGLTAIIILALAVALFVQVSKDANELSKLRSAVAREFSTGSVDDITNIGHDDLTTDNFSANQ